MADRYVSISDGLSGNLPAETSTVPGRFLITTDTGVVYYEPEDGKRIKLYKDEIDNVVDSKVTASQFTIGNALLLKDILNEKDGIDYTFFSRNQWYSANEDIKSYNITGTSTDTVIDTSHDNVIESYDQNLCFSYTVGLTDITFTDETALITLDILYNDGDTETYSIVTKDYQDGTYNIIIPAISHAGVRSYSLNATANFTGGTISLTNIRLTVGGSRQSATPFILSSKCTNANYSIQAFGKNLIPKAMFNSFTMNENGINLGTIGTIGEIASIDFTSPTFCYLTATMPQGIKDTIVLSVAKNDQDPTLIYGEHKTAIYLNTGDILHIKLITYASAVNKSFVVQPMIELGLYGTSWEMPIEPTIINTGTIIPDRKNITIFPSDSNVMLALDYHTTWQEYINSTLGDISKALQTVVEVGDLSEMLSTLVDGVIS